MILAILLQITYLPPFHSSVAWAASKLQIPRPTVEESTQRPAWAAWVDYGPGAAWVVYVNPSFLGEADPTAVRSVAYHEVCHLYLGNNRRPFIAGEEELSHLMVAGCVEWLHGPSYHVAMTTMPCQKWYPSEALRYNRLRGKEPCRAKR